MLRAEIFIARRAVAGVVFPSGLLLPCVILGGICDKCSECQEG